MLTSNVTEIAEFSTIESLVGHYQAMLEKLTSALALLHDAARHNEAFSASHCCAFRILFNYNKHIDSPEDIQVRLKQMFWQDLVARMRIREILTGPRADELKHQLDAGRDLPDVTIANVQTFIEDRQRSIADDFHLLAADVFGYLTPQRSRYKTNSRALLGAKAILANMVYRHGVCDYGRDKIDRIDIVFHMLDGKPIPKHPNNLVCIVNTAIRSGETQATNGYFDLRWFRNSNLHIRFRRDDLVAELNRIGGERSLAVA